MGKLDGKNAIVTGASRGIGAEIALALAEEGANVVCAARTMREGEHPFEGSLQRTVETIRAWGYEATPVAVNISEPNECETLVKAARDAYGPVDVLVNNAALTYFLPVREFAVNRWLRSWAVNFHAPFILSQLVLDEMVSRKSGRIVNISSVAAIGPGRGPLNDDEQIRFSTCYGAEKAALERFSQGLAAEVYADGVGVCAVAPSLVVPTPGTVYHKLVTGYDDPTSEPSSVLARAVVLLATEPLDKVTGRVGYSQQLLKEFGWAEDGIGPGIDPGAKVSGYAAS